MTNNSETPQSIAPQVPVVTNKRPNSMQRQQPMEALQLREIVDKANKSSNTFDSQQLHKDDKIVKTMQQQIDKGNFS